MLGESEQEVGEGCLYRSGAQAHVSRLVPSPLLAAGPNKHLLQVTMALPGMSTVPYCFSLDPSPLMTPKMPEVTPLSAPPPDLSHPVGG